MIKYIDTCVGIIEDQLKGFFVGWPNPPSPEAHLRILHNTQELMLAVDTDSNRVVGFVTAVTDGVISAYIPLLEVLPAYQGRGIGKELMQRLLDKLNHLYMVDLTCDAERRSFYRRLGMRESTGMMIRNFDRQSCEPL